MKKLIFCLLFISMNASAAKYTCRAGRVIMKLNAGSEFMELTVRTVQNSEVLFDGAAVEVVHSFGTTDAYYLNRNNREFKFQFITKDLEDEVDTMFAFSEGDYGAGTSEVGMTCKKN